MFCSFSPLQKSEWQRQAWMPPVLSSVMSARLQEVSELDRGREIGPNRMCLMGQSEVKQYIGLGHIDIGH